MWTVYLLTVQMHGIMYLIISEDVLVEQLIVESVKQEKCMIFQLVNFNIDFLKY